MSESTARRCICDRTARRRSGGHPGAYCRDGERRRGDPGGASAGPGTPHLSCRRALVLRGRLRYDAGCAWLDGRLLREPVLSPAPNPKEGAYERSRTHCAVAGRSWPAPRRGHRHRPPPMPASRPFRPLSSGLEEHQCGHQRPRTQAGHRSPATTSTPGRSRRTAFSGCTATRSLNKAGSASMPTTFAREIPRRDGSSSVNLDFDWDGGHVRGTSENKPVDLTLKEGTQDLLSIQVEVMLGLEKREFAQDFQIIDKDKLKEFIYTQEGTANIRSAPGATRHRHRGNRQAGNNSRFTDVVCAVPGVRAGSGGTHPRRQTGIRHADQNTEALRPVGSERRATDVPEQQAPRSSAMSRRAGP